VTFVNSCGYKRIERILKHSPGIAYYVRDLSLTRSHRRTTCVDYEWARILKKLPRIERLTVRDWYLGPLSDRTRDDLPRLLATVKTARFFQVDVLTVELVYLLASCPMLSGICLRHVTLLDETLRGWPAR